MENKNKNKNKKATTQISLGYGSRESGLQVQKAQAATELWHCPCRAICPLTRGRKAGHATGESVRQGVAFRVIFLFCRALFFTFLGPSIEAWTFTVPHFNDRWPLT